MEVLRVSANSSPSSVAGAIASVMRTSGEVEVQAVGAGAVNQAVKSIAIARGYLAPVGIDLVSSPALDSVIMADQERTAMRFICVNR